MDRNHYRKSEMSKEEKTSLRQLVGDGTIQTYKWVKKRMMAERAVYCNGKRYS